MNADKIDSVHVHTDPAHFTVRNSPIISGKGSKVLEYVLAAAVG